MVSKELAVLGSPISGSMSPQIHAAAYAQLGLDWRYGRFEVDVDGFRNFLLEHPQLSGLSLTMPLKAMAYEFALAADGQIDPIAEQLKAVNTLSFTDGQLCAYNTDVYGVIEALRTAEVPPPVSVAVLGSGATSRSVLMGALTYFSEIERVTVFSRSADAAAETVSLSQNLGAGAECQWLPIEAAADFGGADLTFNTLPANVAADIEVDVPFSDGWLFDVAYQSWPSRLSLAWPEANRISGLEMLLNQALAQVRVFVNGDPNLPLPNEGQVFSAMRAACL